MGALVSQSNFIKTKTQDVTNFCLLRPFFVPLAPTFFSDLVE